MTTSLPILSFDDLLESEQRTERTKISKILREQWDMREAEACEAERLREQGWTDVRIWFSLGRCQGDGAHFTGEIRAEDAAKLLDMPCPEGQEDARLTIRDAHSRYTHAHVVRVEVDTEDAYKVLEFLVEALEEWRIRCCCSIYDSLEKAYEADHDDDAIDAWLDVAMPQYIRTLTGRIIRVD